MLLHNGWGYANGMALTGECAMAKVLMILTILVPLGGCAFVGKVSQGIQCNEPQYAGHPLVRPPARDCAYWVGRR